MRKRILFLQFPQLDNDTSGAHENVPLAGGYLAHALDRAAPGGWEPIVQPSGVDTLGDRALVETIRDLRPHTLAVTVYLWNIERTLWVLRRVRRALPTTRIVVGGPEVAADNSLLDAAHVADVLVSGEGEPVASVLAGGGADFANTAERRATGYRWGSRPAPACRLRDCLPPPDAALLAPDASGMAYVETVRGCPMRCAYCCYNQRRRRVDFITPGEVVRRIAALRARGAREIRFIDPTFNSHPRFDELLRALCRLNTDRSLRFFAEARADTLTPAQVRGLARANFTDLEVGVQSRDPVVLRAIHRPRRQDLLDTAITALADAGVRPTVDLMAGLPLQTSDDLRRSLDWAAGLKQANIQFMHTLLLPGTELRREWSRDLTAQSRPPYRVTRTRWLTPAQLADADAMAAEIAGGAMDTPTQRFVGRRLPGLFRERTEISIDRTAALPELAGRSNRRAVFFSGNDLFGARDWMAAAIRRAVAREPHILWQFILRPVHDEPLDLLDYLGDACRRLRPLVLDSMLPGAARRHGRRASARVLIEIEGNRTFAPSWIAACETLLRSLFH